MNPNLRLLTSSIAALGAAVTVAACSSPVPGTASLGHRDAAPGMSASTSAVAASTTPPPVTPSSSSAPAEPTPVETTSPSSRHIPNELDAVLLSARQVGPGFSATGTDSQAGALPCTPTEPAVDDQVTNVETGQRTFVIDSGATTVSEKIYVYGNVTSAVRHQQITERGLACSTGHLSGQSLSIDGPVSATNQLGSMRVDKAEAWDVDGSEVDAALVLVRIHAVVVQLSFVNEVGHPASVSIKSVSRAAVAKLLKDH